MTNNEKRFRQKVEKLTEVYVAKNRDYGDSFSQSLDKYGIIASLVRMGDKMNRIDSLYDKPTTEVDESLVDSLEDLANYAIMTAIWLEKQVEDMSDNVRYWDDDLEHGYDDVIDHLDMIRELFDDDDDLFDDDVERELDWNDGWHEFDDDDFDDEDKDYDDDIDALLYALSDIGSEDDESDDETYNFYSDGEPKFIIRRRSEGEVSDDDDDDFWDILRSFL